MRIEPPWTPRLVACDKWPGEDGAWMVAPKQSQLLSVSVGSLDWQECF